MLKRGSLSIRKSCGQQVLQYDVYEFSKKELFTSCLVIGAVLTGISLLFYQSMWAVFPLLPLAVILWKEIKERKIRARKKELSLQFKDCIQSVAANMKAGCSVENAFQESKKDIILLYGQDCDMAKELEYIHQGIKNNICLEELLLSLGNRSGISDIKEFGEIFAIAKRNGGNMTDILHRTSEIIIKKIEIDREISILISAKQMEQQIMNIIPFAIILYISFTSPGFFDVLYHNLLGISIMTACLLVYLLAYRISSKIIHICVE